MDELGSGVLNVNRYIKEYSGKSKPLFFEGAVFKMTIPIPQMNGGVIIGGINEGINEGIKSKVEGLIGGISEGLTEDIKEKMKSILVFINKSGGTKTAEIEKRLIIPTKSVERYIKQLKQSGLISYEGSKKTGAIILPKD